MVPMSMEEAYKRQGEYDTKAKEGAKKILEFLNENKGNTYDVGELVDRFGDAAFVEFNASISHYDLSVKCIEIGNTNQYGIEKETENE